MGDRIIVDRRPSREGLPPTRPMSNWPSGNAIALDSNGAVNSFPPNDQKRVIVSLPKQEPNQFLVSLKGEAVQLPTEVGVIFPLAVFEVSWQLGGQSFVTHVDGTSDQFLTVFAESIQVAGLWDRENFDRLQGPVNVQLPLLMRLSAGIARSEGALTLARRTLYFVPVLPAFPAAVLFPAPYAARAFKLNSIGALAGFLTLTSSVQQINPNNGQDSYSTAAVQAAHDAGTYLPIASVADAIRCDLSSDAGGASVEFQLQP